MATTAAVPGWLRVPDDANALAPQVWPERAHRDADGRLVVGGVAATELAERFGTPLYVVDEADARARAARILAAFEAAAASVRHDRDGLLRRQGVPLRRDRALGHRGGARASTCAPAASSPSRSPPAPTPRASGSTATTSPSPRSSAPSTPASARSSSTARSRSSGSPMPRRAPAACSACACASTAACTPRPTSSSRRRTRTRSSASPLDRRASSSAPASARTTRSTSSACTATSARRSSTPPGSPSRPSACSPCTPSSRASAPLPELNLGGGFGIAYTSADDPTPIEEIALGIADAVASGCRALGVPVPTLAIEPGRSIIGPAGITLYTVGTVKPVPIDGGCAPLRRRSTAA